MFSERRPPMKRSLLTCLAGALIASLPLSAFARIERSSTQVYSVAPGGDIRVRRISGTARLTTSGDDISIDQAEAAVHAQTSGGNVRARFSGMIRADSSLTTSGET